MRATKGLVLALVSCVSLLLAGAAVAQEKSTKTEMRTFEVLSVDGNKVVVKTDRGTRELTVPPDWHITMDGKEIGVADLKPGMKGTAEVTTTTTSTPMTVTEVKNADVLAVQANTIIVRNTAGEVKKYTVQDVKDRNVTIMKDGAPVDLHQLRVGDKLSATIITKAPPKVVSETQLRAAVNAPAKPAPAAEPAAEPAPASAAAEPAPAAAPATHAKKLPKTGSDLPLLAWFASVCLAAGLGLTVLRRTRKTS
jgi:LPXTG-motif cell wall-anchored protein